MSEIFHGTIIASEPQLGLAIIQKGDGALSMSSSLIGLLPYSDAGCGTVMEHHLAEGSSVVCMTHIDGDLQRTYVLGPINHATGEKDDHTKWRSFYNIDKFKSLTSDTAYKILDNLITEAQKFQIRDHAHSVDSDALPGDFDVRDKYGANGIHIGRLLSQLQGSSLAYIDVDAIYNTNRRVADRLEDHTLLSMEVSAPEYKIENIAIKESEAFGFKDKAPFEKDGPDDLKLVKESTIPFYRITKVSGAGADGIEMCILEFPKDQDEHTPSKEPQILAKHRTSLMGTVTEASTASITSIKSPLLTGILQLGYGGKSKKDPDQPQFDDVLEPYEANVPKDPEEPKPDPADAVISDAAINKIIDKLLSSEYVKKLKERMLENGLKSSNPEETFGKMYFKEDELEPIGGPSSAQQYELPKSITLTDPVSGRSQTYFASTSFISQEEDGSILIADGYGSEIRMSRGNVYISPALDLFLRPGRDLSAMVPRHQAYNSQGTCTINSDYSVYIHGTKDVKVSGATNGTGVVVIESRATQGSEVPGGLVIKSNSNVSMTGSNLYIGRNNHSSKDKGKVSEPETSGMIIIDAGSNGAISERSLAHTIDTQQFSAASTGSGMNSALVINSSNISLYTKQVVMPAMLNMQTLNGAQQIKLFRNGNIETVNLDTNSSVGIRVNGSIISTGSLHCNGSGKFCKGLVARGIISTAMYNTVPDANDKDVFKEITVEATGVVNSVNTTICSMLKQVSAATYQDYFVVGNEFAFPLTYNVDTTMRMPGMLWQVIASKKNVPNVAQYRWKERYIKGIDGTETACYPGISVWNDAGAVISTEGYKTNRLSDGYIMNAERMNKDE